MDAIEKAIRRHIKAGGLVTAPDKLAEAIRKAITPPEPTEERDGGLIRTLDPTDPKPEWDGSAETFDVEAWSAWNKRHPWRRAVP